MSAPSGATIADAIIAQMASATWTETYDVEREYLDLQLQADAKNCRLSVTHTNGHSLGVVSQKMIARGKKLRSHIVMIAIRKNVDPATKESVDAPAKFAEAIADYWIADDSGTGGKRRVTGTNAVVMGVLHDPLWDQSHLSQTRQFFSMITLTVVETVNTA